MQRRHFLLTATGVGISSWALAACAADTDLPADPAPSSHPPPSRPSSPDPTSPQPTGSPTPAGHRHLLLADFGADTVTFVDPSRGDDAELGSVRVGTAPYGIALGPDGTAWVATAEGVAVVDTAARRRTELIPYRTESGPVGTGEYRGGGMGIAISPDGRRVHVGGTCPAATEWWR